MDAMQFRRASHAVWEAMASEWDARHAYFERTARPVTERMLERLAPAPGQHILELAAGTGVVGFAAAAAVGPRGRVTISDFSAAMVRAARRHADELRLANVECRVVDAEQPDLPDDSVDGVVCRWGYMLMADPARALVQTRRVLRAGGRLSCAVFGAPERNPWVALPTRVLQDRGHLPPLSAGAPGILALADRERLKRLLADAGFRELAIDDVPFSWPFSDTQEYWRFLTRAAGGLAMVVNRLTLEEQERVREQIDAGLTPFRDGGGVRIPALSVVASAS